jgi:hypothetical protein
MEDREYLHNWIFHFNPFKGVWYAIPRDSYLEYWKNANDSKILKSSEISTILEILHKVKGDVSKIKSMLK